ncbi:MAG TPA: EscN/YscN/HrcN family type III secretion system ATPase, partial [Bacillota bacterium]|nr:EscN/YscN/HrcN family type III secretion system ATPase [Bacillota bacterium]
MSQLISPFTAERYCDKLRTFQTVRSTGRVSQIVGLTIEGDGPAVDLGEHCLIKIRGSAEPLSAEVV